MSYLAIWWTSQEDCETIGDTLPETMPEYVREEYRSRLGRAGRGRLWTPDELGPDEISVDPWPETPLALRLGDDYGGIVIRIADMSHLVEMPGIITDLNARQFGLWQYR